MRKHLENYFNRIWYSNKPPNFILTGLSKLYNSGRKRREHSASALSEVKQKIAVPVLVVGNISIGGTGKSPIVLFLINELRKRGYTPGVISRGYGGLLSTKGETVVTKAFSAAQIGDEAFMLFRRTSVPLAVGKNRVKVASELLKTHPSVNIIISDDGLQHYQLQRDVELVIVDGARGFGNTHLLPAGPLREPMSRLSTIDLLLCNGRATHNSLQSLDKVCFTLHAQHFCKLNDNTSQSELDEFKGITLQAFAGIGNPERFFLLLENMGFSINRHHVEDHGLMPEEFFLQYSDSVILMTEKDAVKYPNVKTDNCWYLPVDVEMSSEDESMFLDIVVNKIENMSS